MALPGPAFYILHFASDIPLAFDIFPTQRYLSVLTRSMDKWSSRRGLGRAFDGSVLFTPHIIHFITSTITDTPRLIIRTGEILRKEQSRYRD